MNYYTRLVLAWPKTALALALSITIYFSLGLSHLTFDNTVESFMPKHEHAYVFFNQVKKIYGNNDLLYMLDVSSDKLWSHETFVHLNDLITEIEEYTDLNTDREDRRVARLESVFQTGKFSRDGLIDDFADDPVFQRILERKLLKLKLGNKAVLSSNDIKKLKSELNHTSDFKRTKAIERIVSLFHLKDVTGANDEIVIDDMIARDENGNRILPKTLAEFNEIKKKLKRNPSYQDGVYARDKTSGEITDFGVFFKYTDVANYDPITCELYEIVNFYKKDLKFASFGLPYVNMQYNKYMQRDLEVFLPIVLIVVILVFFYNFRTIRGVVIPLFILCAADIWVLGLMGHVGHPITSIDISLPVLMIAIGSSYSIHILNQYYHDFSLISQKGKKKGLYLSMTHISTTVLLAAITTMIAFITLTTNDLVAIKKWALFSSFGVFSALILSITIIPAGLMLLNQKKPSPQHESDKNKLNFSGFLIRIFTKGATCHSRKVVAVTLIIIIFAFIGMAKLNVETQILLNFKKNDPVRINYDIISQKLGGEIGISVLFDSGEDYGALNPEFLEYIEHIREWVGQEENQALNFGRTDGFSDFIKMMHMAMNNDNPDFYRVPDTQAEVMDYIELYSGDDENNDGRADDFESFIDADYQSCLLSMRFRKSKDSVMGTNKVKKSIQALTRYIDKTIPGKYAYTVTGNNILILKFCDFIVDGQVKSLIFSLGVVAVIVFLLFTNFKAGALAMIPMSNAVIISFGIMGWFAIDLDVVTSVIAAITIGIGVDDTIHFLNTYRYYLSLGEDVDTTIEKTLAVSGKAILFTSFALILGFGVLILSSFKPLILFGLLMAITMITTTIGALLILPSVIRVTQIDLKPSIEESFLSKYFNIGRIFGLK